MPRSNASRIFWFALIAEVAIVAVIWPWTCDSQDSAPPSGSCYSLIGWTASYPPAFSFTTLPGRPLALTLMAFVAVLAAVGVWRTKGRGDLNRGVRDTSGR